MSGSSGTLEQAHNARECIGMEEFMGNSFAVDFSEDMALRCDPAPPSLLYSPQVMEAPDMMAGMPELAEEPEAWRTPSKTFDGDFYRADQDEISRGVTMAESVHFIGRPQLEDEDTHDFFAGPDKIHEELSRGAAAFSKEFVPVNMSPYLESGLIPLVKGFVEADWPPDAPGDPHFTFEPTTVNVKCERPFVIGNAILDFLTEQVFSCNIKVRTPSETSLQKCSIKADVFSGNLACTAKIRMYAIPEPERETAVEFKLQQSWHGLYSGKQTTFAVEFQRRSGDSVAFKNIFQQAIQFLRKRIGLDAVFIRAVPMTPFDSGHNSLVSRASVEEGEEEDFPGPLRLDVHDEAFEALGPIEVDPLLDMAGLDELPALQVEAASAMAALAKDSQAKPSLCTEQAFETLKQLLGTALAEDCKELRSEAPMASHALDYYTASALEQMARLDEAVPYFAQPGEQGILRLILRKVQSKEVDLRVQRKLATVLSSAVLRCKEVLDGPTRDALRAGLRGAVPSKGTTSDDIVVGRELRKALFALGT